MPDSYNGWELENVERSRKSRAPDPDMIAVTTCRSCFLVYEAVKPKCPHCGERPVPADRSKPEHVDGDLVELDVDTLKALRGEVDRISGTFRPPRGLSGPALGAAQRNWGERKVAQIDLRDNISLWSGYWKQKGCCDSEIYRRFYARFGVDIMTAQAYGKKDAELLSGLLDKDIKQYSGTDSNGE